MNKLRILWLSLAMAFLPLSARADGFKSHTFTAAAADSGINLLTSGISYHKLTWNKVGTVSACTVALDTSADGITWSAGGAIAGQTCTSNGASTVANVTANYVRINATAFTGTGSVTVTWDGYVNSPTGGSGTVTSIATTSPITGGPITDTGTIACASCVTASSPGAGVAHFAGSTQTVTSSAVVGADMSNNTVTATQLAAQYSKRACTFGLGDSVNAISAATYPASGALLQCVNNSGVTWTITGLHCFTDNAGTSTIDVANNAGTSLLTGAITCNATKTSGGASGTQSATTTIATTDGLNFIFVADGTSKYVTATVDFTY